MTNTQTVTVSTDFGQGPRTEQAELIAWASDYSLVRFHNSEDETWIHTSRISGRYLTGARLREYLAGG